MFARFLSVLVVLSTTTLYSQDRLKFITIETGINFLDAEMAQRDRIRADHSSYSDPYYYSGNTRATTSRAYGGVKGEIRDRKNFLSLATGLRFNTVRATISKDFSPEYFYYLFRTTGTTTEYLRIRKIDQSGHYLSIPVEARIFPYRERLFRLYFLAGAEFGTKVASSNKIVFEYPAMGAYEEEIAGLIGDPDPYFFGGYGRVGFIIGKEKPFMDIGITAPLIISSVTTLTHTGAGAGFHIQLIKKI